MTKEGLAVVDPAEGVADEEALEEHDPRTEKRRQVSCFLWGLGFMRVGLKGVQEFKGLRVKGFRGLRVRG